MNNIGHTALEYVLTNWIQLAGYFSAIVAGYFTYRANTGVRRDKSRADTKLEIIKRRDAIITAYAPFVTDANHVATHDELIALNIAYYQLVEYPLSSQVDRTWASEYVGDSLKIGTVAELD